MLVCVNCARVVTFEAEGWRHRDQADDCPGLAVAWPPPEEVEEDETTREVA